MRILTFAALSLTAMATAIPPAAGANPTVFKSGGELASACTIYTATPVEFDKTPAASDEPCRSFAKGFLTNFKTQDEARLKAMTDPQTPKLNFPCIRLPDTLTFRDFAQRIVARAGQEPALRDATPMALAERTLEHDFPCPEPPSTP
jgi:hypothetical protein